MKKHLTLAILLMIMAVSAFLHFYKADQVPACLNADEAAFGYNAYSILKTGKDEFGKFLPLRLQSFNDFKLPLYAYLSTPFIAGMGLNEFSVRFLNKIIGILFVPLIYLVAMEMFKNKKVALLSGLLVAVSPWLMILSRQAHEGVLSAFLVLSSVYFILKYQKQPSWQRFLIANGLLVLSTFSYHSGRIFLVSLVLYQAWYLFFSQKSKTTQFLKRAGLVILFVALVSPFLVDFMYGADRVENLLFFKRSGFQMRLDEYLNEHPNRQWHNKGTAALHDVSIRYFSQFSTDFLLNVGDSNPRFGYDRLGLITPAEYAFMFVGLYFVFRRNLPRKWLLILLLFVSPVGNALTWQESSLMRSYFMLFPILLLAAYGTYELFTVQKGRHVNLLLTIGAGFLFLFFLLNNWDIYLNHYFKRALVTRSWQCGYKELTQYVSKHYDEVDTFYITKKHGQPYIYLLFYMNNPPERYWAGVRRSQPDQYGFSQVEGFDKFIFNMPSELPRNNAIVIGYPDDFIGIKINSEMVEKINVGLEEIFWIYRPTYSE